MTVMTASIYTAVSYVVRPFLAILPYIRLLHHKEIRNRIPERYGRSLIKRPKGNLVWIHAASNGEILSALPIIHYLQSLQSPPHILVTTMTKTGAELIQKRVAPDHFTHQFIPYDVPQWVKKFHKHWLPDMVFWIESELWPNHLRLLQKNNVPSVLLNARLSDKSVKRWFFIKSFFQSITSAFDVILAQTDRDKNNLISLGLNNVSTRGNLKDLSPALPFDPFAADDIRPLLQSRPTLLFASTHNPEEEIILRIHQKLKADYPNLLSIIVPRHPYRGNDIAYYFDKNSDLSISRRSLKMSPRISTDIYIADTLGELGLFYHLCPITFIGNSLGTKPGGGHNLLEAAWHHCAIISGTDLHNFSIQAKEMPRENACILVKDEYELYTTCKKLLGNAVFTSSLSEHAYNYVQKKYDNGLTDILNAIQPTCQKAGLL